MNFEEIKKFFEQVWKTILIGLFMVFLFLIVAIIFGAPGAHVGGYIERGDFRWLFVLITYCAVLGMLFAIFRSFLENKIFLVFFLFLSGGFSGFVCWFIPPRPFESLLFYTIVGTFFGIISLYVLPIFAGKNISWWANKNSNTTDNK